MTRAEDRDRRLLQERNIWMATVRPDGRPHLVPVWFVWTEGKLYVCIEPESVKARNLAGNSNVSLALEQGNHPVICEGEARPLPAPWPPAVVALFQDKYGWDISAERQYTRLVEIVPRRWLAW